MFDDQECKYQPLADFNFGVQKAVKLIYQQEHRVLGAPIDLRKLSQERSQFVFDANEWIKNRPSICTKILLDFDNLQVLIWKNKDWENDRRRN